MTRDIQYKYSHAANAHASSIQGRIAEAITEFSAAEKIEKSQYGKDRPLFSLRGVWYALFLTAINRMDAARSHAFSSRNVQARGWGENDMHIPLYDLALAEICRENGDIVDARAYHESARRWASSRDAKEALCWSDLVEARLELSGASGQPSAEEHRKQRLAKTRSALESGLKIASDCGYGILHIDLLLTRARLYLMEGEPAKALDDIRIALNDGVDADATTSHPQLLAARAPECGYAWAIPAALQLSAEALLLETAQQHGIDSFVPAKITELPTNVVDSIEEAKQLLQDALDLWQPLHDPEPERDNQNFRLNNKEYNHKAADTYHILDELDAGLLTPYPIAMGGSRVKKPELENRKGGTLPSAPHQSGSTSGEGIKTIRIFLASSAELREDRKAFDLYFRQQNDHLRKEGIYLEIIRWENFLDAMSNNRLQNEYNQAIRNCDLFVSLFMSKTGKFTEEEFDVACQTFLATGKPLIYTYFRKATINIGDVNVDDLVSLQNFKKKLEELGHFYKEYESTDGLQKHFRDQLDKLRADNRL